MNINPCHPRKRFEFERVASAAMQRINATQTDPRKRPTNVVFCSTCKGFHLHYPTLNKGTQP